VLEARVACLGVSPYRTQSSDTSPRAERVLFEPYRRMEPWQRLRIAFDLQQTVEDAARVGIRERRLARKLTTASSRELTVTSAEDVVLRKLDRFRRGGEVSEPGKFGCRCDL